MTSKRKFLPLVVLSGLLMLFTPLLASAQSWRYDRWRAEQLERQRIEQNRRYYNPYYTNRNNERYWRHHHRRNGFSVRIG